MEIIHVAWALWSALAVAFLWGCYETDQRNNKEEESFGGLLPPKPVPAAPHTNERQK